MQVCRHAQGGDALIVLSVDSAVPGRPAQRDRRRDRGRAWPGSSTWTRTDSARALSPARSGRSCQLAANRPVRYCRDSTKHPACGDRRRRHRPRGRGRGHQGAACRRHAGHRADELRPGLAALDTGPARCCRTRCSARSPRTTRSCSARSVIRACRAALLERGLLLRLRFEFDQYVNLRPVRLYPGVASPLANVRYESVDMLVVREGTEGPYIEAGGDHAQGHAGRGSHPGEHQHRVRRRPGGQVRAAARGRAAAAAG